MCIKKKVLLDLMSKFPDVGEYYTNKAKLRRIEFRRVKI
jgi:hypothetical protein